MLGFEIRLVIWMAVIPISMAAIPVDMLLARSYLHILEKIELSSFRNIKRFQTDVLVENFETSLLIHQVLAWDEFGDLTVCFVDTILNSHRPIHTVP